MQVITFQGKENKEGVYEGALLWSHNFMTMEAEESDAEATANFKLELNDFPDSFINYKEKGYTVELMGTESFGGTETFKIKLVKEPKTVDGAVVDDISFYFFDVDNFVPIGIQSEITSGPGKGMTSEISFSDYDEVDGLYFPFSMTQGVKGQPHSRHGAMTFKSGASAAKHDSKRTWSLPLPVQPCDSASAPTLRAISTCALAMIGRAIEVPSK